MGFRGFGLTTVFQFHFFRNSNPLVGHSHNVTKELKKKDYTYNYTKVIVSTKEKIHSFINLIGGA